MKGSDLEGERNTPDDSGSVGGMTKGLAAEGAASEGEEGEGHADAPTPKTAAKPLSRASGSQPTMSRDRRASRR